MSKKLIVMLIFVLMLPYIQPFYNIVNAGNSKMQCENMSFSVFSIKEGSDEITGSGYSNDQLKLEFINHSKTQNINIDSNGKFNIKIDETLLNKNDAIKISNEYFQIETNVVSENTNDKEVTAKQYKDCPVVEEVEEEPTSTEKESVEETEAPKETTPEADESVDETEVQEDETPSEADEPIEVAKDQEQLPSSEEEESVEEAEVQEELPSSEEEESVEGAEVQEEETTSEKDESVEGAEVQEEETTSEKDESVEEIEVPEAETLSEADEFSEKTEVQEDETKPKVDEFETQEETTPYEEDSVAYEELPEEVEVTEETNSTEEKEEKSLENETNEGVYESEIEAINALLNRNLFASKQGNVINASETVDNFYFKNVTLDVDWNSQNGNNQNEIKLTHVSNRAIFEDIIRGSDMYAQFYIPNEIMSQLTTDNLIATYKVPDLLLGWVRYDEGTINGNESNIIVDRNQNRISVRYYDNVPALTLNDFTFTLTMKLNKLPSTSGGEYTFYTALTTNNNLVDLSRYPIDGIARTTLEAPKTPEAPVLDSPVYSSHNYVRGSGPANSTIEIKIGNNTYTGSVNSSGRFSVTIPKQKAGTSIVGIIKDENGYESQEASVKVIDHLESPEVDDVYSNDTEVTGTAKPNTSVIVTVNEVEYTGNTNSNGEFSVEIPELSPGTNLSVIAKGANGIESEPIEKNVIEAKISFHQVPEILSFNTTEISNNSGLTRIGRENPNWTMSVIDTRGKGSEFKVLVEADTLLTNKSGTSQLPNALVYVNENNNSKSIYGTPVEVFSVITGDDQISQLSWEKDRGLMIEVDTLQVQPEEYGTTLTWTLSNGP